VEYQDIKFLRENHPAIRLLNADNSPLIISFLIHEFKKNNKFSISNEELVSTLSDFLYSLRDAYGDEIYPGSAQTYLDDWANSEYLRKYYLPDNDDPYFELTPSTEKVLEWIRDLEKREFVGTESRLKKIIEILREIAYMNSDDPKKRLEELERQKKEIENEIEKIESGVIERLTETQVKERYFEVYDTTLKLLSDFKQIEYNFRQLDRGIREKQIIDSLNKSELLHDIFSTKDMLLNTDQGRSFRAFWELLMSQSQQDELDKLIALTLDLHEIKSIKHDDTLEEMKTYLIDAGDRVNKTNHVLIEQLRKYLDERVYLENKKIVEIIKDIKLSAVQLKNNPPEHKDFIVIEDRPRIEMIMERPIWNVSSNPELRKLDIEHGSSDLIDTTLLYHQFNIDSKTLKERIENLLKIDSQVSLKSVIEKYPVEKGLAEILIYIDLAFKDENAFVNEDISETIIVYNKVTGKQFKVGIPQVIFCRRGI
jgi:hypothetical protein